MMQSNGNLWRTAVSSSIAFCPKEPSPCRQMTCASGLAGLGADRERQADAHSAERPRIEPVARRVSRDRLAAEIEDLLPVDRQDCLALHEILDLLAEPQRMDVAVGRVLPPAWMPSSGSGWRRASPAWHNSCPGRS
jgi:hypothetical protein